MAEIDKVKEQIGWLKVVFALLIAVDVSLVAWVVQKSSTASNVVFWLTIAVLIFVTSAVVVINHSAQKKIDHLGDL